MAKILGLGTTLTCDGSSIGSIKSCTPPTQEVTEVDVTGLDSTVEETICSTLPQLGTLSVTCFYDAGTTTFKTLGTSYALVLTPPGGTPLSGTGFCKSVQLNEISPKGEITYTTVFKMTTPLA